ncbi:MAG: hypothetical protein RLZZ383_2603, partial [Pseudomonadota bacterium]
MSWSRRAVLQSAAAVAWLAACGKAGPGTDLLEDTGAQPPEDRLRKAFEVWRRILEAVRATPGHLQAERDRLVAAGDVEGLIAFVRDRIAAVPARPVELGSAGDRLWGTRGALRSGVGSMRDKVEVLREGLVAMGHVAVVKKGFPPSWDGIVARVTAPVPGLDPLVLDVTDEEARGWMADLGLSDEGGDTAYDADGGEAVALATSLVDRFASPPSAVAFRQTLIDGLPFVRATIGGVERDINVVLRDLPADDPGVRLAYDEEPLPADDDTVTIELVASSLADGRDGPRTLAALTVPAADLLGRSVLGQFVPLEELRSLVGRDLRSLTTWMPTLRLAAPGLPTDDPVAALAVGAPITLSGDAFVVEDDGVWSPDGPVLSRDDAEAASAAVVELRAVADGLGFPEIVVRADALDARGGTLRRLPASAFAIAEDGVEVPFRVLTNDAPPPRVAFVVDQSGSVPAEFRGAAAAAMLEAAAAGVLAVWPDATFRSLRIGSDPADSSWRSTPSELAADFLAQTGTDSAIWTALADAASWRPTAIVALTDGEPTDTAEPTVLARLARAPAVRFLDIAGGRGPAWDELTAALGADVIPVTDAAQAEAEVIRFVQAVPIGGYTFVYDAPADGPAVRQVRLTLASRSEPEALTSYEVPVADRAIASRRWCGLAVAVTWPDGTTHLRPLAGHVPALATDADADALAVQQAILGSFELHIEGAPPTLAAWLDDLLTARLAWEPVLDAAASATDVEGVERAFFAHPPLWRVEAWLTAFHRPIATTVSVAGLRATLAMSAMQWGDDGRLSRLRRLDVLPVGGWRSWAEDREVAFREAAACGAFVAGMEGLLHGQATVHALAG